MKKENSRRSFLKRAALGTAAIGLSPLSGVFASSISQESDEGLPDYSPLSRGKSVMGLRCEPMERVRIGLIGLGMRGSEAIRRLIQIEGKLQSATGFPNILLMSGSN